jgi:hypothetical protein
MPKRPDGKRPRRDGRDDAAERLTLDSAIGPLEVTAVAEGYMRYSRALRSGAGDLAVDPADAAADDALGRAILADGPAEAAWEAVLEILRRAPDDELGFHAAGPLEDVVAYRGAELVGRIEAEARRDPRFREALGRIWLSRGALPDDVLDRVVRASGGAIRPFGRIDGLGAASTGARRARAR